MSQNIRNRVHRLENRLNVKKDNSKDDGLELSPESEKILDRVLKTVMDKTDQPVDTLSVTNMVFQNPDIDPVLDEILTNLSEKNCGRAVGKRGKQRNE